MFKGLNRSLSFDFKTMVPDRTTLLRLCVEGAENNVVHTAQKTVVTPGALSMSVLLLIVHIVTCFNAVLKWLLSLVLSPGSLHLVLSRLCLRGP